MTDGYKIKRIMMRPNGVEKQVWPKPGWTPGANTVFYFPLESDAVDVINNVSLTSQGTTNYTTVGGVTSAEFTKSNWLYNNSVSQIPQGDSAKTWNYRMYVKGANIYWQGLVQMGGSTAGSVFGTGLYNGNYNLIMTRNSSVSNTYTPTLNTWINVAVTYNNSTWKMYINGTLQVTWSSTTAPTSGNSICLGQNIGDSSSGGTFYGNLSNIILETKEWSADEVLAYYNQTKGNYGL